MVPAPAKPASKGAEKGSSRAWDGLAPALSEWILDAVSSMGFTRMTPVQASTIPLFVGNKDVVVEAVTGSGKTMSFLIPVIERLLRLSDPIRKHHVGAIIISPTRELATQIHSVLLSLLAFHAPSAAALRLNGYDSDTEMDGDSPAPEFPASTLKIVPLLLLGGTTKPAQDLSTFLKISPNLLVATPGRLLELLTSPHVHCPQSSFEVLVMDEADRLLDMGFKDDLQKILQRLPKQRRTGLFSASVSEAVDQLIRVGLRNPVRVAVKVKSASGALDKRTPASLQMSYIITPPSHKLPTITKILNNITPTPQKTILYFSTCAAVDYFQHLFPILLPNFTIVPLHGQLPPNVRRKNFERFMNSVMPALLVTTDVAARGLDIPAVDLVVQIDPPSDPKTFLHRCGRAGRAGRKGLAVTLLTPGREEDYITFMDVRKTPITPLELNVSPSESEVDTAVKTMRDTVLQDRALHDKAQRGFVSWLRSYSKHTASSIFRVADLDWADLGRGWGLLKLPKMPELKGWEGDRNLGLSIDFNEFAYKDKQREKLRKEALENAAASALEFKKDAQKAKKSKARSEAWSDKKGRLDLRQERREKKQTRREKERLDKMNEEERAEALRLQGMIETVRKKAKSTEAADEEWEGFSD